MANTPRRTLIRKAASVGAIAIAATVLGASAPTASAAPATVKTFSTLDNAASWAAVKQAAATGYAVPAKFGASCGATH